MNVTVRRMAGVSLVLFVLLFAQVTRVQFFNHEFYDTHHLNARALIAEYSVQRGSILAGDTVIAQSVETDAERIRFERNFPEGALYSNIHGYKSHNYANSGLEHTENRVLTGDSSVFFFRQIADAFTGFERPGGNVLTTLNHDMQVAAFEGLQNSGSDGGVVAIDPTTGAILAQATNPAWDLNDISSNSGDVSSAAWAELQEQEAAGVNPATDRTRQTHYAPGSTFKTLVAAAAVRELGYSADTMVSAGNSYELPNTDHVITNSTNQCPEGQLTLQEAFARSCNTTFAQMCVEELTADHLLDIARDFGFGEDLTTPLWTAASGIGDVSDPAYRAQSCIGQQDVHTTVTQNAMIAAAVANDGKLMEPYLVDEIQDYDGSTMRRNNSSQLNQVLSASEAHEMRKIMQAVVEERGTAPGAQISGHTVGGKTGTAENTDSEGNKRPNHGWFIAWADDAEGNPSIAVAVFLHQHGDGGATQAAQIARTLMSMHLDG
ncbi:penicillin-binding transpeptidase domain-containing protein [Natronoglycomyces albus]|uniref:Penicillin-binding protein 2 n=1 Tax=Natronoglycomyces albus TaxID=2811108 RepID=A0A895XKS7_9ACTN|nr:penicillin-binding transpeptidase domain-containing protein [Natronoglycomyces albus]QSB05667.1 hypothetical protein JQS30_01685 [Natronoglycomyces albus]